MLFFNSLNGLCDTPSTLLTSICFFAMELLIEETLLSPQNYCKTHYRCSLLCKTLSINTINTVLSFSNNELRRLIYEECFSFAMFLNWQWHCLFQRFDNNSSTIQIITFTVDRAFVLTNLYFKLWMNKARCFICHIKQLQDQYILQFVWKVLFFNSIKLSWTYFYRRKKCHFAH